jgi:hypothetical protein
LIRAARPSGKESCSRETELGRDPARDLFGVVEAALAIAVVTSGDPGHHRRTRSVAPDKLDETARKRTSSGPHRAHLQIENQRAWRALVRPAGEYAIDMSRTVGRRRRNGRSRAAAAEQGPVTVATFAARAGRERGKKSRPHRGDDSEGV